jgi:Uma2 family endonuclease
MYNPQYPRPSVAHDDMGVNAPLFHQQIVSRLHVELGVLYYHKKAIPYEPLPETMLTEGYGNPVPDIILFDHQTEQTRLIIEVCQTSGQKSDLRKLIRLIEDDDYGILEGFVYNYKTGQWFRYKLGDAGLYTESSFSDLLQLDLDTFLKTLPAKPMP